MTREKLTGNVDEAKQAAREIGYPVVMKVMSADIPHKTEAGVIKLGIQSESELAASYGELLEKAKRFKADVRIDGVLIQEMAAKGVETDHRHETGRRFRSRHHGRTGGDLRRGVQGRRFPRPAHLPCRMPGR